ncbi:URE2 [Trichoderma harzianum]|uniref:URE2 n=1 Tax=Trichoderma harzianum TaxID=5544 RepID=A0A0F9WZG8_TRIHA|nr:URE2 [Trichoderma harzianum]
MPSIKPITLHAHSSGPNPWKVVIILQELELPYTLVYETPATIKSAPYTDVNPNGRVPAIRDPNTGITLWESGAIIEYLIENYDTEQKISHGSQSPEKWLEKQFLYFQVSGQGPYFGQYTWFARLHHEQLPSAKERYLNEIKRVIGVLNTILEGKNYLVGEKATYADLSFITWALIGQNAVESTGVDLDKEAPNYVAWMKRLLDRPAVQKALQEKEKASSASAQ